MSDFKRPLSSLVEPVREVAITRKDASLPYIGMEHLETDGTRTASKGRSEDSISMNFVFRPDDILFGKLRPNLRKSVIVDFPGYCSTELIALRPKPGVAPSYAGWIMRSAEVFKEAIRTAEGTRMPRTAWARLRSLDVRCPPIREQQRIAEILDAVDAQIGLEENMLAKHKLASEAMAQSLIPVTPEPHTMGDCWSLIRLFDVVPSVEYGISTPLESDGSGLPVLRMNNLADGRVSLSDIKTSAEPVPRHLLLKDRDVLFNRTNSYEHVGRTSLWHTELNRASFASYLVRLNPARDRLSPEYLVRWLNRPAIQQRIRRVATPAVHQVNINPTSLRKLPIELPCNISQQQEIASILDDYDQVADRIRATITKLRLLKQGLMEDLLTGRVRVSDST